MEAAFVFIILFAIVIIASLWIVFTKAGEPGWAAIVPIYNYMVLARIGGKPEWWGLLMLIPFVNLIVAIIILMEVARAFGKGSGFGLGLVFLGFIFFPILAFSDAQHESAGGRRGRSRRSMTRFDDEDRPRTRGRSRDDDGDDDRGRGRGRSRDDDLGGRARDEDDDDRPRRRR